MDITKATDMQLKAIINHDNECPRELLRQVVIEMMNRGILKGFIKHLSKQLFGTVEGRQIKLGLEYSDILQLAYIGMWKALDKYKTGKMSFSSFSRFYIRSEWQHSMNKFNSVKRTMEREGVSLNVPVNEHSETLEVFLPAYQDVEKTVLMKVYFESQLNTLTPLQRQAVLGHMKGYLNTEIAHALNKDRRSVDRALKTAIEKMGGESYSIKENCGARKGA